MQVSVLASGSKGNCVLVREKNTAVLIDIGISTRKVKKELEKLHMDVKDLDGILITHEHIDHIRGLKTLVKNYQIPIYTRAKTFKAMPFLHDLSISCCNPLFNDELKIGNLNIEHFSISHDAADPVGYTIKTENRKFTLATDLGFVSDVVKQALDNSDMIVLEANHDTNMLQNGVYPWSLKKRILSNRGHLSNNDAGWTLNNLSHTPDCVVLAHLSEKNNTPKAALTTIKNILSQSNGINESNPLIHVAKPDKILSLDF